MTDLISRQAAIDAADRADYTGLTVEDVKKVTDEVVKELKQLPSARPTGKWELIESEHVENVYLCSHCRNYEAWGETEKTPYCPHCGAWMEV